MIYVHWMPHKKKAFSQFTFGHPGLSAIFASSTFTTKSVCLTKPYECSFFIWVLSIPSSSTMISSPHGNTLLSLSAHYEHHHATQPAVGQLQDCVKTAVWQLSEEEFRWTPVIWCVWKHIMDLKRSLDVFTVF